jgi:outer membrane protein TolC
MGYSLPNRRRFWSPLVGGLVPLMFVSLAAAAEPEPLAAPRETPAAPSPAPQVLTLDECLRLALEKQPALAAYRASLASAETQLKALESLCVPTLLRPELPIRRKQAALGVNIATAGLHQAEWETVYAVTRMYLAVLHAHTQEKLAQEVAANHQDVEKISRPLTSDPNSGITESHVNNAVIHLGLTQSRQIEARQGSRRALAALREAIGLGPDCCIQVVGNGVPFVPQNLCCGDLVGLALGRRGELVQANAAADVVSLEVDAQGTIHLLTARTFAAGTDVHARPVPQGASNGEYRPGAISLEMPTLLVGSRSCRVERARDLSARAAAVVDKTRNLIALEVEDQFLKWQQAADKVRQLKQTAAAAAALADSLQRRLRDVGRGPLDDVVRTRGLQYETQAQYNDAVYQHALALAALERATAGGFCAGFGIGSTTQP